MYFISQGSKQTCSCFNGRRGAHRPYHPGLFAVQTSLKREIRTKTVVPLLTRHSQIQDTDGQFPPSDSITIKKKKKKSDDSIGEIKIIRVIFKRKRNTTKCSRPLYCKTLVKISGGEPKRNIFYMYL